jgi:hypothetical protein
LRQAFKLEPRLHGEARSRQLRGVVGQWLSALFRDTPVRRDDGLDAAAVLLHEALA